MPAIAEVHQLSSTPRRAQVETRVDKEYGVYWAYFNPRGRACITPEVLEDLHGCVTELNSGSGAVTRQGERLPIQYGVIASRTARIFNLGGDLALFRAAIVSRDRSILARYGERCIDVLLAWHQNCGVEMTTLSLVQGDALGGGFEGALSANVLVAEESARMGFPEVLFNLFPGMGAYSFLSRKIGRRAAERLITSGSVYSARELYDLGVVDVITPDGTGESAVYSYVKKHAKQGNGRRAFERARNECDPVTRDEMMRVLDVWLDAAMRLSDRDLRMMERLVRAQQRSDDDLDDGPRSNVVALQAVGAGD
jgi:DSF synthase